MDNIRSYRIEMLKKHIEKGNSNEIERFWEDIRENHTPIIEEIEGDSENVLLTFLYQGDKEVENVVVLDGCVGLDYEKNKMERLFNTDIWYKTFKVRNDLRCRYFLTVNDPLNEDWGKRNSECIRKDPLAVQKVTIPKDEEKPESEAWTCNYIELPKAEPKKWTIKKDEEPSGKVELVRFKSKILEDEYRVWIYTPAEYSLDEKPNKMLVLSDGFEYIYGLSTPTLLDNLIYDNQIEPVVVAFIESKENRFQMLTCNEGYAKFVIEEVVSYLKENYNVSSKAEDAVIGGLSLGGLFAAYLGFTHSEVFGNVLSQSGSFWWSPKWEPGKASSKDSLGEPWMGTLFKESEKLNLNMHLETGVLDPTVLREQNEKLRDILLSKGYNVRYSEFKGGHDYLSWGETLAKGLIFLIGKKINYCL